MYIITYITSVILCTKYFYVMGGKLLKIRILHRVKTSSDASEPISGHAYLTYEQVPIFHLQSEKPFCGKI